MVRSQELACLTLRTAAGRADEGRDVGTPSPLRPDARSSRSRLALLAMVAIWGLLPGCTALKGLNNTLAYNSTSDSFITGWRDNVWAKRAYNVRAARLPVGQFEGSFREGFISGYRGVAQGGNGCPPALPPRKFWSWKYQSGEGQCKVQAWYQGYSYGATAADEDGLGNFREIQVSGPMEEALKAHGLGQNAPCINCGPDGKPLPPNPMIDPQIPAETILPQQAPIQRPRVPVPAAAVPPPASSRPEVRPVSYEVERLPPTR